MQNITATTEVETAVLAAAAQIVDRAAMRGNYREVRCTRTQVHRKPLSIPQQARVDAHRDGVVTVASGQSWTLLRAIHDRIGGEITYHPGTKRIASLTLNSKQLAAAGVEVAA